MTRRSATPAPEPGPSNILGPELAVALSQLSGLDPCRARDVDPTDIPGLAASIAARGQISPLIVRPDGRNGFRVLAGGRRHRAMLRNAGEGGAHAAKVRVRVFAGDDDEARALSLAENACREDLHPCDEAEAFDAVARDFGVDQAAAAFGLTRDALRRRIALAALSPRVKAAWRRGALTLPAAEAFTADPSHEAQEALLDAPDADSLLRAPLEIRRRLTEGAIPASAAVARFAGRAYLEAGGALIEDLFGAEPRYADASLLRKIAQRQVEGAALALCRSEGWGVALTGPTHGLRQVAPDFGPDAEAFEATRRALPDPALAPDAVESLHREAERIERAAFLRAVPQSDRHRYAVYVSWDSEGRLAVERGLITAVGGETAVGSRQSAVAEPTTDCPLPTAPLPTRPLYVPIDVPLTREARRVAEKAASLAVADVVAADPHLALAAALAACAVAGRHRRPVRIEREHGPRGVNVDWLLALSKLSFPEALAKCLAQDLDTLGLAFASVVASSIDLRGVDGDYADGLLSVAAARFPARGGIDENFDYPEFFRVAHRAIALAAIRDCGGEGLERMHAWRADDALAKEASLLARAKGWLPEFLRTAVGKGTAVGNRQSAVGSGGASSARPLSALPIADLPTADGASP